MLKMCCSFNIDLFVKLFNVILKSGVYPYIWRDNFIKPLFKGGSVSNPSNYRGKPIFPYSKVHKTAILLEYY
jgi:hypothetical protein